VRLLWRPLLLAVVMWLVPVLPAEEAETLSGPVPASVVRIVDGDTLVVRARIWLGHEVETHVRLGGIDAPELNGRCPGERALAKEARKVLADAVGGGEVALSEIHYGKYAGRVVAEVSVDGRPVSDTLLAAGVARPESSGRRRPWCEEAGRG